MYTPSVEEELLEYIREAVRNLILHIFRGNDIAG